MDSLPDSEVAAPTSAFAPAFDRDALVDAETTLLDSRVFIVMFERSVASARRHLRPVSLILLDAAAHLPQGGDARRGALAHLGGLIRRTLRDADIACRLANATFALVLEDTAETGAAWATERLQIAAATSGAAPEGFVAAIATYPNHGLEATGLLARAGHALALARAHDRGAGAGQTGHVEIAQPDSA